MSIEAENTWICWEMLGLKIGSSGFPICSLDNVLRVLEKWPLAENLFWLDPSSKRILTRNSDGEVREWTREDGAWLTVRFQRELQLHRTSPGLVAQAVRLHAINQALPNNLGQHADDDII